MNAKRNLLKTFLASSSIAAVVIGYAETIFAAAPAARSVIAATGKLTGKGLDKNALNVSAEFENNSSIKFTIVGNILANAAKTIAAIDVNGKVGTSLAANMATTLGSVVDLDLTGGGQLMNVSIAAAQTLTLSGTGTDGTLQNVDGDPGPGAAAFDTGGANKYTALGDIDFVGAAAKLTINNSALAAGAGDNITLNGAFLSPANGTLEVISPLIATHKTVAAINKIDIGDVNPGFLTIDGTTAVVGGAATIDLLEGTNVITMVDNNSILKLSNSGKNTLTFNLKKNFDPKAGTLVAAPPSGIIELNAHTGAGGLILQSDTGAQTLGIANHKFVELRVTGNKPVTIKGDAAHGVDLSNVRALSVKGGAQLISETVTAVKIPTITIGEADFGAPIVVDSGIGRFTLDVVNAAGPVDLLNGGATTYTFGHEKSVLTLQNTSTADKVITLAGANLNPGANATGKGILELKSGTKKLSITSAAAESIGVGPGNFFKEINITGGEIILGATTPIFTKELNVKDGILIAKNSTIAATPVINIGSNTGGVIDLVTGIPGQVQGALVLDATTAAGRTDLTAGNTINFKSADSILQLTHSDNVADKTFRLQANLVPTGGILAAQDNVGIVQITSSGAGRSLIVEGNVAGRSLGTDETHRMKELIVDGAEKTDINVKVFAKKITIAEVGETNFNREINSGVGSELKFTAVNDVVNFAEDTTIEKIDFNNNAGKITVAAGKKLTAILNDVAGTTAAAPTGEVKFAGAGELIGTATNVTNGIAKVTADGALGDILKISGTHKVEEVVAPNASTLEFANGAKLIGSINSTAGGPVNLDFKGNSKITKAIGRVGNPVGDMTFTPGSTNTFGENITMTNMVLDGITFKISADLTVNGALTGADTTIKVGTNELTYSGAGALTGNANLNTEVFNGDVGKLVIAGGALDLNAVTGINITLEGASDLALVRDQSYTLVEAGGGAIVPPPGGVVPVFVSTDSQRAVKWEFNPATLTITGRDAARSSAASGAAAVSAPDASGLAAGFGQRGEGDGLALQSKLGKMTDEARGEAMIDEITVSTIAENLSATTAAVQDVVNTATGSSLVSINSRISGISNPVNISNPITEGIDSISSPNIENDNGISRPSSTTTPSGSEGATPRQRKQQSTEAYGVAAGDDIGTKMGVWASPLYSRSDQKLRNTTPGYRATSGGGTLGFDSMINDNTVIGVAATFVNTNIKHRDKKVGDKTKADTYMLSLYGINSLPKNFFIQSILSFSYNEIENKEYRSVWEKTAVAKYNSNSYGGEVTLGYNHRISEVAALTPTLGLRYIKFHDKGYKETGTPSPHTVAKKSYDKLDGVFGLRLSGISVVNETILIPSVHGTIHQNFIGKKPKIVATIQGFKDPLPTRASKPTKTFYNVGTDLTSKHKMMEYGVGYDAHLAKKYVGHQGTLKIRVNL